MHLSCNGKNKLKQHTFQHNERIPDPSGIPVDKWNFDMTFFSQQSTEKVTYLVFTAAKINMMQAKVTQKAYH